MSEQRAKQAAKLWIVIPRHRRRASRCAKGSYIHMYETWVLSDQMVNVCTHFLTDYEPAPKCKIYKIDALTSEYLETMKKWFSLKLWLYMPFLHPSVQLRYQNYLLKEDSQCVFIIWTFSSFVRFRYFWTRSYWFLVITSNAFSWIDVSQILYFLLPKGHFPNRVFTIVFRFSLFFRFLWFILVFFLDFSPFFYGFFIISLDEVQLDFFFGWLIRKILFGKSVIA